MTRLRSIFPATLTLILVGCGSGETPVTDAGVADYTGSPSCKNCHEAAFADWQDSHHELAMQVASDESMLGDFDNATFDYFGEETRFTNDAGNYIVETGNEFGAKQQYPVTHTFGVYPLQQYLVDIGNGRLQALQTAWDSRPADAGGQRWFHLYEDEHITPGDPLHWTGQYFNWNYMCAECHSTNLQLGYDIETDAFQTSWDEISVGCEACHGPGSTHIAQAEAEHFDTHFGLSVDLGDGKDTGWAMNMDTGIAELAGQRDLLQQPESCGRCHSRRANLVASYEFAKPLADTHMVSFLDENLYYADGRIQDEVYVYGSFVQSKMFAAGVTCSDCHNPHSLALKTGPDPNQVCAQCHLPATFATAEHDESDVGNCVDCHMPATTYMGVDDRRDHSFRIPNAGEAADHYGRVIAAGRSGNSNGALVSGVRNPDYPAIARATMLTLLQPPFDGDAIDVVTAALSAPEPSLRIAALRALRLAPPELRIGAGSHLLRDSVRGVRLVAAVTFAEFRDLLPAEDARAFTAAADEHRHALLQGASMSAPAIQLGEFESQAGNLDTAERYLRHAVRLDAKYAPARHSLGLFLVRSGRHNEALAELEMAATLDPEASRFTYVYGVALNSLGQPDAAIDVLSKAHEKFVDDFDIGWALATILRDNGDREQARRIAVRLLEVYPGNANVIALRDSL